MFLSSGERYVKELLELHPGCQGPFRGSRGKVGFLSRRCSGKGPHLVLWGKSDFSRFAAGNLWFFLSYDRDVKDPLLLPQESPVSMLVARGLSGFLCSCCQGRGPHLELRSEPHCSSPVPTCISVFLFSFSRGVSPRLLWINASPLSSQARNAVSGFLSG